MSLIEHEWQAGEGRPRRFHMVIGDNMIETCRQGRSNEMGGLVANPPRWRFEGNFRRHGDEVHILALVTSDQHDLVEVPVKVRITQEAIEDAGLLGAGEPLDEAARRNLGRIARIFERAMMREGLKQGREGWYVLVTNQHVV